MGSVREDIEASESETSDSQIVFPVYSLFDPLGFITPYVMKAKLLLQTLSRKKLSWDDPLEKANKRQWKRWLDDLPKLHEIQVDPWDLVMLKKYSFAFSQTLLGKDMPPFERCYQPSSLCTCICRLELTAAVISVRLSKIIREELDMTID